jgi:uncharacterized protein (DUF1330 family)
MHPTPCCLWIDPAIENKYPGNCQANVVIRFPSQENADAFYSDPEYGPMKQLRITTTGDSTVAMGKEFVHPA